MNLKKAMDDIIAAKLLLSSSGNPTNYEGLFDLAAYHIQQGIEKAEMEDAIRLFQELLTQINDLEENKQEDDIELFEMDNLYGKSVAAWQLIFLYL